MLATIDPLTGLPIFSEKQSIVIGSSSGSAGGVRSIVAGANITVNNTDPLNPIVSSTGGGGGGSGTVTTVSVATANGFAGSVANPTTTPAITVSTSVTGIVKGNGTALSTAVAGTDYQIPISLTTTGSSGAASFNTGTGVLNIPQYSAGSGGIGRSINSISSTTTGAASISTDYVYICTSTFTFTLPTAVSNTNLYTIKNFGTGIITVSTTSSQTIDGGLNLTIQAGNSIDVISNNSNWAII